MAFVTFPTVTQSIGQLSRFLPISSQLITTSSFKHNKKPHSFRFHRWRFPFQTLTRTNSSHRHERLFPVSLNAANSEPGEEDSQALDAVLRLYSAIKKKSTRELSDIIADECHCLCNFFSTYQSFQGKKQVLDFFSHLIRSLGSNIEFVVTPTMHEGMNVGLKWRLEWKKTHLPLGKGFSFHVCHVYHGKVVIRNVEMFLDPLRSTEPFRLITIGFMTTLIKKIGSKELFKDTTKIALYIMLAVLIVAVLFRFKDGLIASLLEFLSHKKVF